MGTTETELRQEIAQQRARMGETLDQIGERISPERIVERRKNAMRAKWSNAKVAVMGSPDYDESGAHSLRSRAGEAGSTVTDSARSAAERAQQAPEEFSQKVEGNPIAAGLIAFGAGLLAATLFPPSQTEKDITRQVQPAFDGAKEHAREVAQDVASEARDKGREAFEDVKASGSEATQQVKERVSQSKEETERSVRE